MSQSEAVRLTHALEEIKQLWEALRVAREAIVQLEERLSRIEKARKAA